MDEFHGRTWKPGTDISEHQTELATSLRIPLLTSPYPRWAYVTGIVIGDDWCSTMPTEVELRAAASFADQYRAYWYRDGWKDRMARFAPYDIDGGANLAYLLRYDHGGWAYQKRTWQHGARPFRNAEPMSLLAVMDRVHNYGGDEVTPTWAAWKADHQDVLGPVAEVLAR